MAQCVVCSRGGKRICELCSNASYCSAEHQYTHWLQQHKNECTYENAGDGVYMLSYFSLGHPKRFEVQCHQFVCWPAVADSRNVG